MSVSIAIVCTVNELADHATGATRLFAANISVGVTVNPALPLTATTQNLLSPWLWTLDASPVQIYVQRGGSAGPSLAAKAVTPVTVNPSDHQPLHFRSEFIV